MLASNRLWHWNVLTSALVLGGCVSQEPTIAHIHIGHSMTAASDTPGEVGYFVLAEQRANEAVEASNDALRSSSIQGIKSSLQYVQRIVIDGRDYPLAEALAESVSHITYAATSNDASANVQRSVRPLEEDVKDVVERIGLLKLYLEDALASSNSEEIRYFATEIHSLCIANVEGIDLNDSGRIGDGDGELGLRQIRKSLEEVIGRENPPYSTVSKSYLFNLVRLDNGEWTFRNPFVDCSAGPYSCTRK